MKIKAARISDLNSKLKGVEDKDERSKLFKELNDLNSKSEQLTQKKSTNQAQPDAARDMNEKTPNIPITTPITKNLVDKHGLLNKNKVNLNNKSAPPKPPRLSVLNEQIQQQEGELAKMEKHFGEDLKKANIDIKGMDDKEIQDKLRYTGTLPLQYDNIQNKKSELGNLKSTKLKLIKGEMDKVIKERKEIFQGAKDSEQWNNLTNESRAQWNELTEKLNELNTNRSKLDGELDKLSYQSRSDVNNTKRKFAQQISQENEKLEQQNSNNRSI